MKKSKGKYHIIMMCCGYVESAKTSWLIYTSVDGRDVFNTKVDAVKALALDLYNKYVDENNCVNQRKNCCENATGLFCSTCGRALSPKNSTLDGDGFMNWICSLHETNCDSYGESEFANGQHLTFWPWRSEEIVGAKTNEVVFLQENAECILAEALYDQKPELMDEETKIELERCLNNDDGLHMTDWQKMKQSGE